MRSKKDEPTFSSPDAWDLLGRLSAQWAYLGEEGRGETLVQEFIAQFDGYDPLKVQEAATRAIGKCTTQAPTVGAIKAELRTPTDTETRPSDRHGYRPWHNYDHIPEDIQNGSDSILGCARRLMRQGCAPEYIPFREKERALMRETVARMNAMSPETYAQLHGGFTDRKSVSRAVAQLEE